MNKLTRRCKPRISIASFYLRCLFDSHRAQGKSIAAARAAAIAEFNEPLPF